MTSTLNSVSNWNDKANKRPAPVGTEQYWKDLQDQLDRVREELDEVEDEIICRDLEALTKETCDLDFVTAGFIYLLQSNHEAAMIEVICNNNEKIYNNISKASATYDYHADKRVLCTLDTTFVDGEQWFTVKRIPDNKVLKPQGLSKVNLSAYTPQEVS